MSLTGVPQEHRPGAEPAALTVRQLGLTDSRNATPLVQNLSFALHPGRVTGLVGESGSGKSLTARALLGLLPATIRQQGEILLGDVPTSAWNNAQWRQRRGRDVAMIFQDPLQALNPLRRVGSQMAEVWWRLQPSSRDRLARRGRRHCHEQLCQALLRVHLEQPETVLRSYPHQLSGGMRQRVMIAMALLGQPKVLLADEPTAALDGQSRGSVLQELQRASALSRCAVLLISHDLSVVEHCCDELLILYGGVLVEQGVGRELLTQAAHPYTRALVGARPRLGANADPTVHAGHLPTIHGQLQAEHRRLQACVFAPRCPQAQPRCRQQRPQLQALAGRGEGAAPSRLIACHYPLLPATDFSAGESE